MSENICRSGIVKKITEDSVEVQVLVESACSGCHAKSACPAGEMQEKVIYAMPPEWPVAVGDRVEIRLVPSLGYLAVSIAYLLPVVLLLATLFTLSSIGFGDGWSALVALAVAVAYFGGVWLFRARLQRKFKMTISRPAMENRDEWTFIKNSK